MASGSQIKSSSNHMKIQVAAIISVQAFAICTILMVGICYQAGCRPATSLCSRPFPCDLTLKTIAATAFPTMISSAAVHITGYWFTSVCPHFRPYVINDFVYRSIVAISTSAVGTTLIVRKLPFTRECNAVTYHGFQILGIRQGTSVAIKASAVWSKSLV